MTTPSEKQEWRESLKVGDNVAFNAAGFYYKSHWVIKTVERITKTQIITTGDFRFRKKDGSLINSNRWNEIKPVTDGI